MSLSDVRLAPDQSLNLNVVVLADDGKIRVIAQIRRAAIEEYFDCDHTVGTQAQRVSIINSNLSTIGEIMASKYAQGEFTTCVDTNNVLIIIEDLSDAHLSRAT